MKKYDHKKIELKWREKWEKSELYKVSDKQDKPKYYVLDMFPYPSGEGLHVGHPKGYIATDIFARAKMMQGYNVLHPMGWDAFGLPAENYAIKNKVHPREAVEKNIAVFKGQLKKLGFTYDWEREINTTDPEYYKWTQWAFLQMFKKGLAYESHEPINWCPSCKTGLANEDLENGKCERCGSDIERKPMRQWVLKITDYADRLLADLEKLPDWEESIKEMQKNWIGRSEGAEIKFKVESSKLKVEEELEVFTTRPDTLFGCTYMVVCPEHQLIQNSKFEIQNYNEVEKYIKQSRNKSDLERTDLNKEKTGIKLDGISAVNPVNQEKIPIYAADYVLSGYGTGAIMAVPAHDERDWEFAKKYDLPIKEVVAPYLYDNPRKDKETEKRNVATAIVKNPQNNKYLCLKWNTTEWQSFPTGGIDNDSLIEAAKRELVEETGYKNIKFIKQIGGPIYAEFYRPHKDSNVFACFKYLFFELKNEEREEVDKKEKDQHSVIWVDEKEVKDFINVWNQKIAWKRYIEGNFAYSDEGININSDFLDGLKTKQSKEKIINWLEEKEAGKKAVNYKLKDWVFGRQRYWGEPIPIIHCEKCGAAAVPEKDLPVKLPEVKNYEPSGTGESPLANIDEWVNTKCPKCGSPSKRETNTMPQWAGSSWYYLRYIDPRNGDALVDKTKEKYWSPVDFYVGGAEHATRHLIYARFWHKFLFDIGAVNCEEPFSKLRHVGLILAEDGRKMSKRWGNAINPDEIVEKYGADAMRVYEMFMGPFSQPCAWNTKGLIGAGRFLEKVWKLKDKKIYDCRNSDCKNENSDLRRALHKTIKKVSDDIENFRYNTAIAQMMIFVNFICGLDEIPRKAFEKFLKLLAPFAPHLCEELWSDLGNKQSIFKQSWPEYNPDLAKDEIVNLIIQVNGKLRDMIEISSDASEEEIKKIALESEKIKKWLKGEKVVKIIFVKGKLANIVLRR